MKKDIYIIKNTLNDMVYIGQSKDCVQRWGQHISDAKHNKGNLVDKAMHKLGADKFYYQVLESNIENYDEREKYWIERYGSKYPNGYNVAPGGKGVGKGIDNVISTIKDTNVLEAIKQELKNTKLSNCKIAEKYGCNEWTIFAINNGKAYIDPNCVYPIRESNRYTKEKLKQIRYSLKYELDKDIMQIAKEYGVDPGEVSKINQGQSHILECETYPLRKGKVYNTVYPFVDNIIELLKTDIPQKDIAKKFNVSVNCVSNINTGKSYRRSNEEYPIRTNYQGDSKRNCFSPNEIKEIENALSNTSDSMRLIARNFETTITTIININNGVIKKYRTKGTKYPIRDSSVTTIRV